jgi:SpoVK/Ycf46/Vps4 family AAA+-type ATPase
MEKQKEWSINSNQLYYVSKRNLAEKLKPAIYSVQEDRNGDLFLEKEKGCFTFDYKLYGLRDTITNRLTKIFENNRQVGCLLNGLKGTGKSVTSKVICNKMIEVGYPVLIVNKNHKGICEYISSIQEDLIIFIDEFEKVFDDDRYSSEPSQLLSMLDGAMTSDFKRLFLLTSNNLDINDNLKSRPGRIRYIFEFSDLTKVQVEEIVDDILDSDKVNFKDDIIEFISKTELISVDAVKAVVGEVNLFNESPLEFKDFLNVLEKQEKYNLVDEKGVIIEQNVTTNLDKLMGTKVNKYGTTIYVDDSHYGYYYKTEGSIIFYKDDREDKGYKKMKLYKVRPTHLNFIL